MRIVDIVTLKLNRVYRPWDIVLHYSRYYNTSIILIIPNNNNRVPSGTGNNFITMFSSLGDANTLLLRRDHELSQSKICTFKFLKSNVSSGNENVKLLSGWFLIISKTQIVKKKTILSEISICSWDEIIICIYRY